MSCQCCYCCCGTHTHSNRSVNYCLLSLCSNGVCCMRRMNERDRRSEPGKKVSHRNWMHPSIELPATFPLTHLFSCQNWFEPMKPHLIYTKLHQKVSRPFSVYIQLNNFIFASPFQTSPKWNRSCKFIPKLPSSLLRNSQFRQSVSSIVFRIVEDAIFTCKFKREKLILLVYFIRLNCQYADVRRLCVVKFIVSHFIYKLTKTHNAHEPHLYTDIDFVFSQWNECAHRRPAPSALLWLHNLSKEVYHNAIAHSLEVMRNQKMF